MVTEGGRDVGFVAGAAEVVADGVVGAGGAGDEAGDGGAGGEVGDGAGAELVPG